MNAFLCRIDKITDRPMKIVNDSAAGWAGSLGLEEGDQSCGRNRFDRLWTKISLAQKLVRADGMMVFLMKALVIGWERKRLELFSKESDGRVKKRKVTRDFPIQF